MFAPVSLQLFDANWLKHWKMAHWTETLLDDFARVVQEIVKETFELIQP